MLLQLFFKDIVLDFLYFPIWWYTRGLVDVLRWAGRSLKARESAIGLRIWIRNLFTPMYGQADWKGRIISFIFRILILGIRLLFMIVSLAVILALVLLYLAWPVGAIASFLFLLWNL